MLSLTKRYSQCLLILLALLGMALLPSITQAQDDPAEDGSSPNTAAKSQPDTVSVRDVVDDQNIESRLQSILEAKAGFTNPVVVSDQGVVTLTGTAENEELRIWAEQLARRTEDVVDVQNQIDVDTTVDFSNAWSIVSESLFSLWQDFLRRLPQTIAAICVLFATWFIAKITSKLIIRFLGQSHRVRQSLKDLFALLSTISIWVVGLLLAAIVAFPGMTPSKALTVLGLGSVAIGFAFKDIFENFFAGVLILWKYPLDRGDIIEIGDVTGRVEEITVRNTLIRRLTGELTVVPNANIFKQEVDVLTNRKLRRAQLTCGVAYSEDVDQARSVILKAVKSCSTVNKTHEMLVLADAFAESSINFEVFWWTQSPPMDMRKSRDEVISAIKQALDTAGIEIPFPYRTLTFKEPLKINKTE